MNQKEHDMRELKNNGVFDYTDSALVVIDYQQDMYDAIRSETSSDQIDVNIRYVIRAAKVFKMPIVLSTVAVASGTHGPTVPTIQKELPGVQAIDRRTMNAWEDSAFRSAVEKTGRKRLIFGALFTEICLTYPVVSALKEGYDVGFLVDAVGGRSQLAHRTAIERVTQAGAVPVTAHALVMELFRDWGSPVAADARNVWHEYRDAEEALLIAKSTISTR